MYSFSQRSQNNLNSCDPRLQEIADIAISLADFAVTEGHRTEDRQNELRTQGKSQLSWPNSKHNSNPSLAFDLFPHPYDWGDREAFMRFSGLIIGIAAGKGINLRWGGDWDRDWDVQDNRFNDWPHFEIIEN